MNQSIVGGSYISHNVRNQTLFLISCKRTSTLNTPCAFKSRRDTERYVPCTILCSLFDDRRSTTSTLTSDVQCCLVWICTQNRMAFLLRHKRIFLVVIQIFVLCVPAITMATISSQRIAKALSGSCLCRSLSWNLKDTMLGQILVCHCTMCRRMSGSSQVPFVSLPRQPFWQQLEKSPTLSKFQATPDVTRYFCSKCSSFMFMHYHHEQDTMWIPMGTIAEFPSDWIDEQKDSHIFQQDEAEYLSALDKLKHFPDFGTYKSDNCCGKAWEELESFGDATNVIKK